MTLLPPGTRVRLSRPENPNHFRRGLVGVVRESESHQPPRPRVRFNAAPSPAPPPRAWLVVSFPDCPRNGAKPFHSFLWQDEVTTTGAR